MPGTGSTGRLTAASAVHQVELHVDGRVTPGAVARWRARLVPALAAGGRFTVLLDRRAMTGPTAGGRAALDALWAEHWVEVARRCLAWADVYDERRAASLERTAAARAARVAARRSAGEEAADERAYVHRYFTDVDAARTWLDDQRRSA